MKLDKRTVITGFLVCLGLVMFTLGYINTTATTQVKVEKESPINTSYLPKTATEIKIHGNGWVTFRLGDKEIVYFRHPFDHQVAITALP